MAFVDEKKTGSVTGEASAEAAVLKQESADAGPVASDSSIPAIIRSISWPRFPDALKMAFGCLAATAALSAALYIYNAAIRMVLGYFFL